MPPRRFALVVPALLFGLTGCGRYEPPVQGDHNSAQYKSDLDKCRTSSAETLRLKNAATPSTWIMSLYTGPSEVRAAIRACMTQKGYALENTSG
jgi:hypothetical protein